MTVTVCTDREPLTFRTEGLAKHGHAELRASVSDVSLVAGCAAYLRYVADYIVTQKARIESGETVAYGFWLTRFVKDSDAMLEAEEYRADASDFVPGVSLSVRYWQQQHEVCAKAKASFDPPRPDKKVAVSKGVLNGEPVEGVRYPSPEHMSGWWITSDSYNGDVKTLDTIELYRLTSVRPDLSKYLALPPGHFFETKSGSIGFDQAVADETA